MGKIIAIAILLLTSASVAAGWFGPDNYDDCVLEKMKGQKMKVAIIHARNACRKEFPIKPKPGHDFDLSMFGFEKKSGSNENAKQQ